MISALNTLMSAGLERSMLLSEVHTGSDSKPQSLGAKSDNCTSSVGVTFSTKTQYVTPCSTDFPQL